MTAIGQRVRRDPGLALLVLALLAAALLYAPTLGRGLTNYDDPWLVRDNWILQHPSVSSVRMIAFDLSSDTRATLGAEYLPVRDLSIMLDVAVWGSWTPGFHLTNVVVYLAALALWFAALTGFGIDRRIVGLAVLIWAVHPTHAESVAWIAERKGLLAIMFAGAAAYGYTRFRSGGRAWWLALASAGAVAAVWSKAPAVFAIASLAALELVLPEHRRSVRRALVGLGVIAAVSILAFVPILKVALGMAVVSTQAPDAGHGLTSVLGLLGFYLRLGMMAVPNAISYGIALDGPSTFDIVLGALGLALALAVLVPFRRWRASPVVRAASLLWLLGWFPSSRLVLPVKSVIVADRYLLFPSLGLALAIAVGVLAIPRRRSGVALAAVIVLAGALRTLDAQSSWRDNVTLWQRAVSSSPGDSDAWSQYAEALSEAGDADGARAAVARGMELAPSPRLQLHAALLVLGSDRARGIELMRLAATGGEPHAMTNLAVLLDADGKHAEALDWARRAVATLPLYAHGHRIRGKVALAGHQLDEALAAFERAYELEPQSLVNRYNVALALVALGRFDEARPHLEAALSDPQLAAQAQQQLAALPHRGE